MVPVWFKNHAAYTMAKYGMSMCVLGMAEEFRDEGIAVNALWPKTGNIQKNLFSLNCLLLSATGDQVVHGYRTYFLC
jgi:NAD(P)-dependent dehydrogenase (short-subunit alcohol dehydrogenase family)